MKHLPVIDALKAIGFELARSEDPAQVSFRRPAPGARPGWGQEPGREPVEWWAAMGRSRLAPQLYLWISGKMRAGVELSFTSTLTWNGGLPSPEALKAELEAVAAGLLRAWNAAAPTPRSPEELWSSAVELSPRYGWRGLEGLWRRTGFGAKEFPHPDRGCLESVIQRFSAPGYARPPTGLLGNAAGHYLALAEAQTRGVDLTPLFDQARKESLAPPPPNLEDPNA